ncbi:EamA family transporter [Streptomyces sp. H10-C2]|uniref:EamA family transporter n=1 Tax=unclassified Streptomyces TaxID=2593676 RepID=UPI0024BBDDE5|nr:MULTISPECIES: EamA family transporter [unclassified Streptomyces]MDJ0347519.1 EamA family transporter [Streptomyces sp. PH10-H1]MDJ0368564.1 EamA family transporter [Streptomyces sp. H10-C2]
MTAVLALATSLLWGLADFGGGLLTRRLPALVVVVASQIAAAIVLGAIVVATGAWSEAGPQLWYAVAAGVVGPVALLCFYKALAQGPMGVVSPLATIGVVIPLGVGLTLGERPGLLQYAGIAVAVVGVALAGGPQLRGAPVQRQTVLLTLVAAFGFGSVFALISEASSTLTGLFLALFVQRVCSSVVGGAALAVAVRRDPAAAPAGGMTVVWAAMPALTLVGLADVAANGTYSLAAQHGPVTVAAVLASLYPVVTALAARGFLKERLLAVQAAGAGLAMAGTVLLAAG